MKLGKLLAAGKSIMKGHTEISYRSSKQIYLPKFGSAKNPFKSEASEQSAEITPSSAPEVVTETRASASGPVVEAATADPHPRPENVVKATPASSENSPAIHGWVRPSSISKGPTGTTEMHRFTTPAANPGSANSQSAIRNPQSQDVHAASKQLAAPQHSGGGSEKASTLQRFNAILRSALGKSRPSDKSPKNQRGTATQTELSLDSVKVVHNDLSDVDVEVVPIKSRSAAPDLPEPKKSWEYVGERLFGVEAT